MLGSIAALLDCSESEQDFNFMKVKSKHIFELLLALEQMDHCNDFLEIMALVHADKPLKALDLCYKDDPNTFSILNDALSSCVTVCAYSADSRRAYQMLVKINWKPRELGTLASLS